MKIEANEITVNGTVYVPKGTESPLQMAKSVEGLPYVLIRTRSAGVHIGYLESRKGMEVKLLQSRRIWYWSGANSLSQLAMEGVKKPKDCKFSMPVESIELTEAIEIIEITEKARVNLNKVEEWKL